MSGKAPHKAGAKKVEKFHKLHTQGRKQYAKDKVKARLLKRKAKRNYN